MPRHRDPVFIGSNVCIRPVRRLLQVRRQRQVGEVLVFGVHRHNDYCVPSHGLLNDVQIPKHNGEHHVHDDRNPDRFASARALQIVLQLDQQVRHMRIQIAVGRFPVLRVVEAELLRLRLLGSNRILEWNLRDRHALD